MSNPSAPSVRDDLAAGFRHPIWLVRGAEGDRPPRVTAQRATASAAIAGHGPMLQFSQTGPVRAHHGDNHGPDQAMSTIETHFFRCFRPRAGPHDLRFFKISGPIPGPTSLVSPTSGG